MIVSLRQTPGPGDCPGTPASVLIRHCSAPAPRNSGYLLLALADHGCPETRQSCRQRRTGSGTFAALAEHVATKLWARRWRPVQPVITGHRVHEGHVRRRLVVTTGIADGTAPGVTCRRSFRAGFRQGADLLRCRQGMLIIRTTADCPRCASGRRIARRCGEPRARRTYGNSQSNF